MSTLSVMFHPTRAERRFAASLRPRQTPTRLDHFPALALEEYAQIEY